MISDERRPATADPVTAGPATAADAGPSDPGDAPGDAHPVLPADGDQAVPPPPPRPGVRARLQRFLTHEWTVAALVALLVAVALTWPTLEDPLRTIPQDVGDPSLQAWQMAWTGHALLTDPLNLWHANAFYPEYFSLAFSDSLLGYAPVGFFGEGFEAAILRYNIMYVLVHALAFFGAYALLRQLGAGRIAGAFAGVAFAYAPWRLAHGGHLNVLSTGGIVLALAMLARGHGYSLRHGYRPERRRPAWAFAGWLVAAWQLSLGFGLGVPFGYVLGLTCLVALVGYGMSWLRHRRRPAFGRRLLVADVTGGVVFLGVTAAMALPYLKVVELNPYARRSLDQVTQFSPPASGFLTAPGESWLWGDLHTVKREALSWAPEMALLPGFLLIVVATLGVFFSVFRVHQRILLLAGVAVTVFLGLGTSAWGEGDPGYVTLYNTLPGWDALRTPGRLVLWTTILLCVLAAGAIAAIESHADRNTAAAAVTGDRRLARRGDLLWLSALVFVPLALVESVNNTGHPVVDPQPAAVRDATGPLMILPAEGIVEAEFMLWTVDGFPRLVNGLSGVTPNSLEQMKAVTKAFPDPNSVAYLRAVGVRTVVVLPERLPGTEWDGILSRPVDGLGIRVETVENTQVYHLSPDR